MSTEPDPSPPAPMVPWVLLRGLTREAGHWGDLSARLRAAWPQAPVLAIDLPGNGRLHRQRSPWTVAGMAEAARAHLRAQGIPPPYRLLALSMGAMVATDWASRHPAELAAAVLINTSFRPYSPWWQRMRPGSLPRVLGLWLPGRSARARETTVLQLTSRLAAQAASRQALLDDWTALRQRHPVNAANALRQLVAAARFRAPRRAPPVPLLVLASRADGLVNPACSAALAQHWALPLAIHPQAGHDLPLDDAGWVVAAMVAWAERGYHAAWTFDTDRIRTA